MRSLQSRFLTLILLAILIPVCVIGWIAVRETSKKSDADAISIMNLTCQEEADKIDYVLDSIETSVELVAGYALRHLDSTDQFFEDEDYRAAYTADVERLFIEVAENTDGAVSFYYRYNAEAIESTQGFLYTRDSLDTPFHQLPLTDISLYDPDDAEHVGWYYIPVRNGVPTWMAPYQNKNLDIYMISYVIPLFQDDRLLGILGMDVNFQVIIQALMQIHPYETGYAFLTGEDGSVLYHPSIQYGTALDGSIPELPILSALLTGDPSSAGTLASYQFENTEKKLAYTTLINGSVLSLVADTRDINQERDALLKRIYLATIAIAAVFMVISLIIMRRTLTPLKQLTAVADQVASGNLDVKIPTATSSEIESLVSAYTKTVDRMKKQLELVDNLAHRDELTGLYNRSSFREKEQELNQLFEKQVPSFAVVMIDVNNLKQINDTYGHEAGDLYLKHATDNIQSVFGKNIYRIGGDEFVVFLEEKKEPNHADAAQSLNLELQSKMKQLEARMSSALASASEPWERFDVAYGTAICTDKDTRVQDVFDRADSAMYQKKVNMKENRL